MGLVLQPNPTFEVKDVALPLVGGGTVKESFTFAYLSRPELAELTDRESKHRKQIIKDIESEASLVAVDEANEQFEFDMLKRILRGWSLEAELNDDNIRALVRQSQALPAAVYKAFRGAYETAREGN